MYTAAEQEAVGLCVALEAIANIANHALLEVRWVSEYPGEAEIYFQSRVHQQLFLTRLLDFAREQGDKTLTGVDGSCLDTLHAACTTQSFNVDGSVETLESATSALDEWLNSETSLKLWLPTLDIEADLRVPRVDFPYIAGNQVKHNLSHLTRVSRRVEEMLKQHGYAVRVEHIPLALEDFQDHFQEHYFVYYGTWIVELLKGTSKNSNFFVSARKHRAHNRSV